MVSIASHAVAEFLRSEYSKHGDGTAAFGHSDRLDDSRTPRNATPVCPCEGYLLAGGGHIIVYSPAQAYGISWLIRKRPPETRIGVDYVLCRAAHVCSFLFFPNQRTRQGRAEYGASIGFDSTVRYHTIPHGKGALQPGTAVRVSVATPVASAS